MEEVARGCNSQEVANILWSYATMGRAPGERVPGVLEARVEGLARERNSHEVATTFVGLCDDGEVRGRRGSLCWVR